MGNDSDDNNRVRTITVIDTGEPPVKTSSLLVTFVVLEHTHILISHRSKMENISCYICN